MFSIINFLLIIGIEPIFYRHEWYVLTIKTISVLITSVATFLNNLNFLVLRLLIKRRLKTELRLQYWLLFNFSHKKLISFRFTSPLLKIEFLIID